MFLKLNSKKNYCIWGIHKRQCSPNHCNITNKQIYEICDGSKKKINKFTPGSNIKIIPKSLMRKKNQII